MKMIFKGDAVRNTYTLDTGLEKIGGSDVRYFAREPKLVHHVEEVKNDVILEKDMSLNRILLTGLAEGAVIDGINFGDLVIETANLDENTIVLRVGEVTVINDGDVEEQIETYNKLMEDYRKQQECDASCDGCFCREPKSSCEKTECDESETKEDKERKDIEERIFEELFGILGI